MTISRSSRDYTTGSIKKRLISNLMVLLIVILAASVVCLMFFLLIEALKVIPSAQELIF